MNMTLAVFHKKDMNMTSAVFHKKGINMTSVIFRNTLRTRKAQVLLLLIRASKCHFGIYRSDTTGCKSYFFVSNLHYLIIINYYYNTSYIVVEIVTD